MSNHEPGERVFAFIDAKDKTVRSLGYGTYKGEEIPPAGLNPQLNGLAMTNPKIELDNGKVVWGFECWWGKAEACDQKLKGATLVPVDIDEMRAK